jgi:hypothetical protein
VAQQKWAPGDLAVEECMERFEFARVTEEMRQVFDAMDRDNGVLIGSPEKPQGILTPMDFLRYLYKVASPFVMISEIELTLRALIRLAVNQEALEECAMRTLAQLYGPEKVPTTLEAMTFDNYKAIIAHSENWPKFEAILGGSRTRVAAKLKQLTPRLLKNLHKQRAQVTGIRIRVQVSSHPPATPVAPEKKQLPIDLIDNFENLSRRVRDPGLSAALARFAARRRNGR